MSPALQGEFPVSGPLGKSLNYYGFLTGPSVSVFFFFPSTYFIHCMTSNATSNLLCLNSSSKCSEYPMAQLHVTKV